MNRIKQTKKNQSKYRSWKILLFIVAIIFIGWSFIFIMNDKYLLVKKVTVLGAEQVSEEDVEDIVENILEERFFSLIPKSNIFFVPNRIIERKLQERFLTLDHIETDIIKVETLRVEIIEKTPKYLYCTRNDDVGVENSVFELFGEKCWYVDEGGLIFMESPYFSDNVYIKFDIPGEKLSVGDYISGDKDLFNILAELFEQMDKIGVKVKKIRFEEMDDIVVKLIRFGERNLYNGGELRININNNIFGTIANLELLMSHENFKKRFFENKETLDYIDLRFGNKIIYKFYEE